MKPRAARRYMNGFTLMEVMIVLAIVAILSSIALPSYKTYTAKQKARSGQSDLVALSMNMENYLQNTTSYPSTTVSTAATQTALSGWNPAAAGNFTYTISAVTQPTTSANGSYTLTATGIGSALSGCTMTLNSANTRTMSGCPDAATTW